jgi:hypothetical protein
MVAGSARRRWTGRRVSGTGRARRARWAGRRAANSPVMSALARAGLAARGVIYFIIGVLAIQIALDHSHRQADRSGAVRLIAGTPLGTVALWLLVIGFAGMALWRLSQAIWGGPDADSRKPTKRLTALARAVFYSAVTISILEFAIGLGAPSSSDKQSKDLTAAALHHTGGQIVVVIAGLCFIGGGLYLAYRAWKKKFRKHLRMGGASPAVRTFVERLGQVGGIARGVIFTTAGIFLVIAGIHASPGKAKGIDSALRALTRTPAGPWLLVAVAVGLAAFGLYSLCEARWREV